MNPEIPKLEAKRREMQDELMLLRSKQVSIPGVTTRVISLSTMLADCDQMLATARAFDVNNKRATENNLPVATAGRNISTALPRGKVAPSRTTPAK